MATYLILNLFFMAVCLLVLKSLKSLSWNRTMILLLAILVVSTAIFDSLIITAGIVAYDTGKISGLVIGLAPIEDFMYAILAVVIIPNIWDKIGGKNA